MHVIKGVIEAEQGAIEHYSRIVEETDGIDPVTQDMVIAILHDEQGHKRLFEGFLREYEAARAGLGMLRDVSRVSTSSAQRAASIGRPSRSQASRASASSRRARQDRRRRRPAPRGSPRRPTG